MAGRLKTAFVSGTILNNPLAIGGTTLSSNELSTFPTITAPDIGVIVLDPRGTAGAPEVVWVTAHTAAATTATITRAQEGTTARAHLLAVAWVHGPTIMDFTQRKGSDIASAGTITLPSTDEDYFHITGTTGITAISERGAGKRITLEFDGICLLTHNSTSLILASGCNISTRAGDVIEFVSEASGNWRQATANIGGIYTLVGMNTTEQSTVSTTDVDLVTVSNLNIPLTQSIRILVNFRKSAGSADLAGIGLKLNATTVAVSRNLGILLNYNEVTTGFSVIDIGPRSANYLRNGAGSFASSGASGSNAGSLAPFVTAAAPNAVITSITIIGKTDNAAQTLFVKEVLVFVC